MGNVHIMARALELAENGRGRTSPNPVVGAVIVKDGKIIGEGFHEKYGGPHAEINAFRNAEQNGYDVSGAEMYVTLEPCAHYGKTPPCAEAIVNKNIKKVYIGASDPNALVAGKGIEILKKAGIEVEHGLLEKECIKINEIFFKYILEKKPFVVWKSAMTIDGKIASYTGDSKWISCERSRNIVQIMRNSLTGIMVGVNTVIEDNPKLTVRLEGGRNPIRIVVDSRLRTPLDSNVINEEGECIIATVKGADLKRKAELENAGAKVIFTPEDSFGRVDLKYLMGALGEMGIDSILLEGGGELNFSALEAEIIDKAIMFIAPKIIGGKTAKTPVGGRGFEKIDNSIILNNMEVSRIENDILIQGYIRRTACLQE